MPSRAPGPSKDAEKYRAFVEQSSEGIWCFEVAEAIPTSWPEDDQVAAIFARGFLAECNVMMARMYGVGSPAELVGCRLGDLMVPADPRNAEYLRAFIRSGYRLTDAETHEVGRDGRDRYFLNNLTGIIEKGGLCRAWGVQRDVTDRRALEEQLRLAHKLEAVGRLAGGIAHDFNNLLTAVRGNAELALKTLSPGDPACRRLEQIEEVVDRGAALVRELLAFGRRETAVPSPVALGDVVTGVSGMLERLLGDRVQLGVSCAPGLPAVLGNRSQLEQVIVNLVVNARDAMPAGGRVTVEVRATELDEAYARDHAGVAPGPYVMLSVTDTGTGMTREVQERIFDPFFTTKAATGGTGLGLATVYGIVRNAGGHPRVYSEPGQGTTFKVYLPAHPEARVTDAAPPPPVADPPGGSETILLVEDDPGVREMVADVLSGSGYTVHQAPSGGEALAAADGQAIDLLVTDLVMPGLNGPEIAARLAATRPALAVLFMSGYTEESEPTAAVRGGTFLEKPFSAKALLAAVRKAIEAGARRP